MSHFMFRPPSYRARLSAPAQAVHDYYKRRSAPLTHVQKVTRTYRRALKQIMSWNAPYRSAINTQSAELRAQFDAMKNVSLQEGEEALEDMLKKMFENTHPDPYGINYMPGGCTYMRYVPPPLELVYPDGVPADIADEFRPVYYDQVPAHWRPDDFADGPFICDNYSKQTY